MSATIPKSSFEFLQKLKQNNHRDWMQENKKEYLANEKALKIFYAEVEKGLNKADEIAKQKIFRINRDIRFSNDKTPYNVHRSVSWSRAGAQRRGGYYLRLEPGNSFMAGGFLGQSLQIYCEFEKSLRWMLQKLKKYSSKKILKKRLEILIRVIK